MLHQLPRVSATLVTAALSWNLGGAEEYREADVAIRSLPLADERWKTKSSLGVIERIQDRRKLAQDKDIF
jgi:hypothetical protein